MHRETRLPPPLAAWIVARLLRSRRGEALVGDLAEAYQHGRSPAWYWRQAVWACAARFRQQPPRWLGVGALRVVLIACVFVGASLDAKWPFFLLALDPSWLLLLRWHHRRRQQHSEHGPCVR